MPVRVRAAFPVVHRRNQSPAQQLRRLVRIVSLLLPVPCLRAPASRLRLLDFPVPHNLRGSPELLVITEGLVAVDVVALKQGDARVQLEG